MLRNFLNLSQDSQLPQARFRGVLRFVAENGHISFSKNSSAQQLSLVTECRLHGTVAPHTEKLSAPTSIYRHYLTPTCISEKWQQKNRFEYDQPRDTGQNVSLDQEISQGVKAHLETRINLEKSAERPRDFVSTFSTFSSFFGSDLGAVWRLRLWMLDLENPSSLAWDTDAIIEH